MNKKKRIKWLIKHTYPNGYTRAGVISNNPIKCDVIALEYTYNDTKAGKIITSFREMSIDEALVMAEVLVRAVSRYTEYHSKIYSKPKQ